MLNQDNASELNFNHAFPFDVIRYREADQYTDTQIKKIIDTVWNSLSFRRLTKKSTRKKYRAVVKNYVLNLIKSYQSGYFIRVSRNRNDHHYEERYSHIYTTPAIVIKSMDSLYDHGWIDLHMGFFDRHRNEGKQTRIYPSQKFIDLVNGTDGVSGNRKIKFTREGPKEIIQLRRKISDKQYRLVDYKDTPKTILMRQRIKDYNDFMSGNLTILCFTRKELRDMKSTHRDTFNNMLLNGSMVFCDVRMSKGSKVEKKPKQENRFAETSTSHNLYEEIDCNDHKLNSRENDNDLDNRSRGNQCTPSGNEEQISGGNNPTTDRPVHDGVELSKEYFRSVNSDDRNITITSTNTTEQYQRRAGEEERARKEDIPITKTLAQINEQYHTHNPQILFPDGHRESAYCSIDEILNDYPKSRKFWFRIPWSNVFRAFSDTSKTFNHHGRFYGDTIQNLPQWMRDKITMGHKDTVECDYTSIHPTMLYTMAGAVPPDNIYMIDKGTNPQLRKEYKAVLLVSINHKDPNTMWSAVSLQFREDLGYKAGDERLTKKYIMEIYDHLLEHNKPIAHFMNTGVAMRLMRKDSEIADKIINQFAKNEIPIRCVHDSFIVPAEYEEELKSLMVYYFQKVMDTDYKIGITTETTAGDTKENALNAAVMDAETRRVPEVKVEIVDTEDDSGDDSSDNDLDDNTKYFEGVNSEYEDDSLSDFDWGEVARNNDQIKNNRFEGIRF